MPRHTTSVDEMREAGILIKPAGTHVIRVLGAVKEVQLRRIVRQWHEIDKVMDRQVGEQYRSGALTGTQEDPGAQPYHPSITALYLHPTEGGLFLERDWET